jgi:hypothetical protein
MIGRDLRQWELQGIPLEPSSAPGIMPIGQYALKHQKLGTLGSPMTSEAYWLPLKQQPLCVWNAESCLGFVGCESMRATA